MRYSVLFVAAGLSGLLFVPSLTAQRARFGVVVGHSVPAGDTRTIIDNGTDSTTGVGEPGLHLRGFVEVPLAASSFSFRGEVFFNRLTGGPNTYAFVGGRNAKVALLDQAVGFTGSFVTTTSSSAAIAPYFSLGAGLVLTTLGYNPNPGEESVTHTQGGLGLGMVMGAGLRIRTGGPTVLMDVRYYQALNNTRGSAFLPLSIGVVF